MLKPNATNTCSLRDNAAFLLDDKNHNAAHIFALAEFILEEMYLGPKWLARKHNMYITFIGKCSVQTRGCPFPLGRISNADSLCWFSGLGIALASQYVRSLAMITAASNFSHLIQLKKAPEHSLVRSGIYAWSRHPSYFAFFYWALGTQIFIGNPVSFVAFFVILYRFFSGRIRGVFTYSLTIYLGYRLLQHNTEYLCFIQLQLKNGILSSSSVQIMSSIKRKYRLGFPSFNERLRNERRVV